MKVDIARKSSYVCNYNVATFFMQLAIVSIGNSKGIRIPKAILDKYQIKDSVEVEMRDDALVLRPVHQPRVGWDEAFRQMHQNGDDRLLIPDVFEDEVWETW